MPTINFERLPSVALCDGFFLPHASVIYFAVSQGRVLYVGQSVDVYMRWRNHHKYQELSRYPNVRIYWLNVPKIMLDRAENDFIKEFLPPLNDVVQKKTFLYNYGEAPWKFVIPAAVVLVVVPAIIALYGFTHGGWNGYMRVAGYGGMVALAAFAAIEIMRGVWLYAAKVHDERILK